MNLARLTSWWASRRPKKLNELLAIEFDDDEVRVRVLQNLEDAWNQSFHWREVTRVCFRDGGISSSDMVFVTIRGQDRPLLLPTEAQGGSEFFGALCHRGLLPEHVWRKALGDTVGGTHCWPPYEPQEESSS